MATATRSMVSGQRVSKSGPAGTTYFVYDEQGHLIGEYDASGAVRQEIVYLARHAGGERASVGVRRRRHLSDLQRSPQHAAAHHRCGESNGMGVATRHVRCGCGERESERASATFAFNLRFPGQYYDAETGLHYNYFRDYDPSVGRYVESDPIGLKGGINTFSYVDNSPTSKKDALGLATYMCRQPLHACSSTGNQRCFADIPGNPFYHQYLCVIEPNGNVTCGGQDRTGNPFSSPGKPSEDHYPFNRPNMCENKDPRDCVDKCVQRRIRSPERPRYGIPLGTDCQEWSDDVLLQCQSECKGK